MRAMRRALLLLLPLLVLAPQVQARTVYRCVRDGTVSLATAPEPGSRCEAKTIADDAVKVPNLWGALGVVKGNLYEREQDGKTVYSTRKLPGSTKVLSFTVETPPGEPAHAGLGQVGKPQIDRYAKQFKAASKKTGVDDAYLRAIAHAESGFNAAAVSPKGAVGVMQLMPETAREFGADPTSPDQSIDAAARMIRQLATRYRGDLRLVAAAYNAGSGVVSRYGGVPPYRETQQYLAKVEALYMRYRSALGKTPKSLDGQDILRAAD
ncbi:lytic transglycosylase domain-containing protein [Lysobacter claricitrinus]|uniref:lytic transglycosylase domain-containing protein n=1 Tax=Lysobacter claricitrinus TaxID=3367728 RepID=UPI0038B36D3E